LWRPTLAHAAMSTCTRLRGGASGRMRRNLGDRCGPLYARRLGPMANFRVHVLGAAIPSALAAGLAFAGGLVTPAVGGACFGLGVLGGMLPDIDAETSVPTRIIFGALALAAAAVVGLALRDQLAPRARGARGARGLCRGPRRLAGLYRLALRPPGPRALAPLRGAGRRAGGAGRVAGVPPRADAGLAHGCVPHGGLSHPPRARRALQRRPPRRARETIVRHGAQARRSPPAVRHGGALRRCDRLADERSAGRSFVA
jgi:hypothetical protein